MWFPWQLNGERSLVPAVLREAWGGGGGPPGPPAPSFTPQLLPVVKWDRIHFGAILEVFRFVPVVNFALSKSPIITHSWSIFFKYYGRSSRRQECSPCLGRGKGIFLGCISENLWRRHRAGTAGHRGRAGAGFLGEMLLLPPMPLPRGCPP